MEVLHMQKYKEAKGHTVVISWYKRIVILRVYAYCAAKFFGYQSVSHVTIVGIYLVSESKYE
jgi:hypothetical protein